MVTLNIYKILKYAVCIQLTLPYFKINAIPRIDDLNYPIERIAFGSCNDQSLEQLLWDPIMEFKNELFIWMGDAIYADFQEARDYSNNPFKVFEPAKPNTIQRSYKMQLEIPSYNEVASKMPIIGVWDDHDYGTNDGNNKYPHREESQKFFLDFLHEPEDSILRKQKGVNASYVIGSGEKTIKIILLDNRYHKDPYDVEDGEMLGKAQWEWFERELKNSTAAFNIIVSGIQMLPTDRFFPAECWYLFPLQRKKLLDLILQSTAKGVVLLSGDVHTGELNEVTCGDEQTIKEITSSGMTHSWLKFQNRKMSYFTSTVFNLAQTIMPWEFRPDHGAVYGNINYGQIEIDWAAEKHPVATISVRGENGKVQLETKVVSLPTQASNFTANDCTPPRPVKQITRTTRKWVLIGAIGAFFWSLFTLIFLWFILIKHLLKGLIKHVKEKGN